MKVIMRCLRSPKFFYVILGLLVLQSLWIALTARYPQAFDENYHFGLIQLHAHQWLPYFTHQPPGQAIYGAVARDPSYLYHYLLSFPYRLLIHLTTSQTIQVIALRLINIGIFVWGLYVYRKLLAELGASKALSHVVLLFFVLTPVVPLLAAQINYDNLMFALTGLLFLFTVHYYRAIRPHQFDGTTATALLQKPRLPLLLGLQIIAVGAFGSIVTFPFAPLFAASVLILAILTIRASKLHKLEITENGVAPDKLKLAIYAVIALIAVGLCFERYGLNIVKYHVPVPECHAILSIDDCQAYAPWARDYLFAATYPRPTRTGILVYPAVWAHRTVYETMFTITSTFWEDKNPGANIAYYYVGDPLPIANDTAWAVIAVGSIFAALYWRTIWRRMRLRILLGIIASYLIVLFGQNFAMYLHTGEAVAIHGRYLVPVYPVLYLVLALSFNWFFNRYALRKYKPLLFIIVILLFLQGAGLITWIARSEASWFWPGSAAASQINWIAQEILRKIVLL